MTTITATLDQGADPDLISKIIENVKGVMKVTVNHESILKNKKDGEAQQWIDELHQLVRNVDRSVIDLNDEKTRYILSK